MHPYDFAQAMPEQEVLDLGAAAVINENPIDPPILLQEDEETAGASGAQKPEKQKGKGKRSGLTQEDIAFLLDKFSNVRRTNLEWTDVLYRLITAEENDTHMDDWLLRKMEEDGYESVDDLARIVFNMLKNNLR